VARITLLLLLVCVGCGGAMIEPGHRGLLFDSRRGLMHEVLLPGYHRLGPTERIDDYDVTYAMRMEALHLMTQEMLPIDVKVAVIHRPIVAELYQLETEVGRSYYDELIGPELRSAMRSSVARHSYIDLTRANQKIEDELEAELRMRLRGKHIEISSVVIESASLPPDLAALVRAKATASLTAERQ
jgi:regulator of protease activity HflC (stomatin/prohibitin superfamily)